MVRDRTPSPEIPRFREISRTSCRKMATKLGLAMAYVLCLEKGRQSVSKLTVPATSVCISIRAPTRYTPVAIKVWRE